MTTPITGQALQQLRTQTVEKQTAFFKKNGISDEVIKQLLADGKIDKADTDYMSKRIAGQGAKPVESEASLLKGLQALDGLDAAEVKKDVKTDVKPTSSTKYADVGPLADVASGKVTLKKGAGGPAVAETQNLLEKAGFKEEKYGSDGKYGPRTKAKVEEFQKTNGLKVTGEVDSVTLKKLQEVAAAKTTETTTNTAALSEGANNSLTTMKGATTKSEDFKTAATNVQKELDPKLDAKGKTDLKGALDAAHDARFGATDEVKKEARTKFEASMKALDGKLDPAALASMRELVPADKVAPAQMSPASAVALGNMKSTSMNKETFEANAKTVSTDLGAKLDPQGQKDLAALLNAARDARYPPVADQAKAKEAFAAQLEALAAKLDPKTLEALGALVPPAAPTSDSVDSPLLFVPKNNRKLPRTDLA